MNTITHSSFERADSVAENAVLRSIYEGTASANDGLFLHALVSGLVRALRVRGGWVAEYCAPAGTLRTLACYCDGERRDGVEYPVAGSPCAQAILNQEPVRDAGHGSALLLAPRASGCDTAATGYLGAALRDSDGAVLGVLAVIASGPVPEAARDATIFRIFAARAAAELQRLRAEAAAVQATEKLADLINGAIDAIVAFDAQRVVTAVNPAGRRIFRCAAAELIGSPVSRILSPDGADKLLRCVAEVSPRPAGERTISIPGGLAAVRAGGAGFAAEATLTAHGRPGETSYTLVLRDSAAYRHAPVAAPLSASASTRIYTTHELLEIERNNIICALELTGWRVSGDDGAAQLLDMNASTLSSRIKVLGICRPERADDRP